MAYKIKRKHRAQVYSANEIFRKRFPKGGKNFVTPNVERKGKINKDVAFELSSGSGFSNDTIYGVTLVSINREGETRSLHDLSKPFKTKGEAETYINQLKSKLN